MALWRFAQLGSRTQAVSLIRELTLARTTAKQRVNGTADSPDEALRRDFEQRLEALNAVNALRAPLWEAVAAELDGVKAKTKSPFSRRAAATGKRIQKARDAFHAGELTRERAIKSYERGLTELRDEFDSRSIDALWKHAHLHPSTPELLEAWLDRRIGDEPYMLRVDKYLGLVYQYERLHERPDDLGIIEQGLGDPAPPPLGTCVSPPYQLNEDRVNAQVISVDNIVRSRPFFGVVTVDVMGDLAGGASGYSLVGADFMIPAGFTAVTATASLNWSFSASTFAVGGGATAGGALMLRVEDPVGTTAALTSTPLFTALSPVLWGNGAMGSGTSDLTASIATPDGQARTVRVFAGLAGHAECAAIFAAGASLVSNATVTKICIRAT
jgi:hypothetical protein